VTAKGLLNRAHAYKASVQSNIENGKDVDDNVNMGLYNYPVLMAADILLFGGDVKAANSRIVVPVGTDQKQHIEIASDIAKSFNSIYGKTLAEPVALIKEDVAVITGLDGRKMSKSYGNIIPLFCDEAELLKCIKKIPTDSTLPTDPKPKDHLIYQLYRHFTGKELEQKIGWGDAKQKLFEGMNAAIKPMRDKYNYLMAHFDEVEKILQSGAEQARKTARETLNRVRAALGVGAMAGESAPKALGSGGHPQK
jgi:tryptophanyl-tRNA synthetase